MFQISRRQSLLGLFAMGVGAAAATAASPARASGLGQADLWKTLKLVRHDGTRFTLADVPSRVVLAVGWMSSCPSCRDELPRLAALPRLLGEGNIEVVLLSHPGMWARDYPVAAANGLGTQAATIDPSVSRATVAAALGMQDGVFDLPQSMAFARPDMRMIHAALGPVEWTDGGMLRRLRRA